MKKLSLIFTLFIVFSVISCKEKNKQEESRIPPEELKAYSAKGDSIVKKTFDTLRGALLKNIAEKGIPGAIEYCNVNAYPITAYYARHGITIRRAAGKFRNPANAPDSIEKIILERYMSASLPGENIIMDLQGRVHYFKPIMLQAMCKNCHGNPDADIPPEALAEILKRYPGDSAVGFKEGDLRGIWHLVFTPDNY